MSWLVFLLAIAGIMTIRTGPNARRHGKAAIVIGCIMTVAALVLAVTIR